MTPREYNYNTRYDENRQIEKKNDVVEGRRDTKFIYYTSWYESRSQSLTRFRLNTILK